jgi:riboflavin kinase/FMN adenylyltransferase
MKIHTDPESFNARKPVVTIGIFDGVHLGHDYIIRSLHESALQRKGSSVILTLWPHPRAVLDTNLHHFRLLNTLEEKITLLERYSIDHLVILTFTKEFSRLSSCDFVREVLVDRIGISHLLIGYNHRFGKDREGDFSKMEACARKYSFSMEQLPQYGDGSSKISSSVIRELLLGGDISRANKFLGYRYFITGRVTGGRKIGRIIGFPTANIQLDNELKLIPRDGVYAVRFHWNSLSMKGMMNIGIKPTVNDNPDKKTMEVHIFDFEGDIYDQPVRIEFIGRLRDEMKFESISALEQQLRRDREHALKILGSHY